MSNNINEIKVTTENEKMNLLNLYKQNKFILNPCAIPELEGLFFCLEKIGDEIKVYDKNYLLCPDCLKVISIKEQAYRGAKKHLNSVDHKNKTNCKEQELQPQIKNFFSPTESISDLSNSEKTKIKRAVIELIANENLSVLILKKESFLEFIKVITAIGVSKFPRIVNYFSRIYNNFTNLVDKVYEDNKSLLIQQFKNLYCASLTTDLWSNRKRNNFIGYTIHYIDENFQFISEYMGIKRIRTKASADLIKKLIHNFIRKYLSKCENVFVTSDNGPNIVKACKDRNHIRCSNHNLALALCYLTNSLKICTNKKFQQGIFNILQYILLK